MDQLWTWICTSVGWFGRWVQGGGQTICETTSLRFDAKSPWTHFVTFFCFFFFSLSLGTLLSPPSPVSHNVFNVFASNVTSKGGHQTTESKIRQMFHYFTLVPRNTLLISSILCHVHEQWGTAVAQWLRCCATNRKVAGSICHVGGKRCVTSTYQS